MGEEGVRCTVGNVIHHVKFFSLCSPVDSMARAPMQGIKTCTGYYGCNWCLHPGIYVEFGDKGAVKFPVLDDVPNRTEAQTIRDMEQSLTSVEPVNGIKRPSCLINLRFFNIIWGFVPDYMHALCLGIAKYFMERWLSMLSPRDRLRLDSLIEGIRVPNHLQRLSRSIGDRKHWKSREWENWLLYYSLPILRSFPQLEHVATHWALLVEGFYILMQSSITRAQVNDAHNLLREFVLRTELLYGKACMTFNVHQLLHLAQSVLDWGPLWAHSCYCFESFNSIVLKEIHSAKGVIHQVCRSVSMRQSELLLRRHVGLNEHSSMIEYVEYLDCKRAQKTVRLANQRYFGKYRNPGQNIIDRLNLTEHARLYYRMVKDGCLYTANSNRSKRTDNSYAQTVNGDYIQIKKFIVDEYTNESFTECTVWRVRPASLDRYSPTVILVDIIQRVAFYNPNDIKTICVCIKIDDITYLTPLPNLHRN
ncbi:hypothetical protein QAD02_001152 [Eretmocerus hayati]|uniref:Uncharacterized protein n=1 Tax=Eretmocerus hayati TaxID=131215 RepID=A0ACC2NFF8_9HYME|nr:hypothetical protein QAD02_001152 [Eretmocerus hayati]